MKESVRGGNDRVYKRREKIRAKKNTEIEMTRKGGGCRDGIGDGSSLKSDGKRWN